MSISNPGREIVDLDDPEIQQRIEFARSLFSIRYRKERDGNQREISGIKMKVEVKYSSPRDNVNLVIRKGAYLPIFPYNIYKQGTPEMYAVHFLCGECVAHAGELESNSPWIVSLYAFNRLLSITCRERRVYSRVPLDQELEVTVGGYRG